MTKIFVINIINSIKNTSLSITFFYYDNDYIYRKININQYLINDELAFHNLALVQNGSPYIYSTQKNLKGFSFLLLTHLSLIINHQSEKTIFKCLILVPVPRGDHRLLALSHFTELFDSLFSQCAFLLLLD